MSFSKVIYTCNLLIKYFAVNRPKLLDIYGVHSCIPTKLSYIANERYFVVTYEFPPFWLFGASTVIIFEKIYRLRLQVPQNTSAPVRLLTTKDYWISRATKRGKEIQFPGSRD